MKSWCGWDIDAYYKLKPPHTTAIPPPAALSRQGTPESEVNHDMAASQWTVNVPDRSTPFYFSTNLTAEEVRSALISVGHTSVENAEMVQSGNTLTFRRPVGGTKGV